MLFFSTEWGGMYVCVQRSPFYKSKIQLTLKRRQFARALLLLITHMAATYIYIYIDEHCLYQYIYIHTFIHTYVHSYTQDMFSEL